MIVGKFREVSHFFQPHLNIIPSEQYITNLSYVAKPIMRAFVSNIISYIHKTSIWRKSKCIAKWNFISRLHLVDTENPISDRRYAFCHLCQSSVSPIQTVHHCWSGIFKRGFEIQIELNFNVDLVIVIFLGEKFSIKICWSQIFFIRR